MILKINTDTIAYQGLFLAFVAALSSTLLLWVFQISAPTIALRNSEDQIAGIKQVVPNSLVNNELVDNKYVVNYNEDSFLVFPLKNQLGEPKGFAVQSNADGFSGDIVMLVATNEQLQITGVRILSHAETPGLGDKIEIAKSTWVQGFDEQSLTSLSQTQWGVKKDGGVFDQFTGATITPRAVVAQVYETLVMLNDSSNWSENND